LVDVVTDLVSVLIVTAGQIIDVAVHVAWTILHEIAVMLWNLLMLLVKVLASVVMQIFSSGIVQNLLKVGIDLIVVLLVHIALPLLMAMLDLFLCVVNFLMPGTWPEQLRCIEQVCFQEDGDVGVPPAPFHASLHRIAHSRLTCPFARRCGDFHNLLERARRRKASGDRVGSADQSLNGASFRSGCQRQRGLDGGRAGHRPGHGGQRGGHHVRGLLHLPNSRVARHLALGLHDVGVRE
jgi:hypothetical protein